MTTVHTLLLVAVVWLLFDIRNRLMDIQSATLATAKSTLELTTSLHVVHNYLGHIKDGVSALNPRPKPEVDWSDLVAQMPEATGRKHDD